jgi:DNA primase small subunit
VKGPTLLTRADQKFVESLFKRYYLEKADTVYIPERINEREFGYFPFEEKTMIRHLYIDSPDKLREFLIKNNPLHVYHSAAFYKYPSAPMEEKEWMGAELAFDIDADHLKTLCRREHDFKVCSKCFTAYPNQADRCSKCDGVLIDIEWVCESCLEAAKQETIKLIDFLEGDLGFKKIRITFSGNRGYHIVIMDEEVLELGQLERKEIVDYITGTGISLRVMGLIEDPKKDKATKISGPDISDPGWRGRIARASIELAIRSNATELSELLSIDYMLAQKYVDVLRRHSEEWSERCAWDTLPRSVVALLGKAAANYASAKIDVVVTSDIHRLIRLANTLNGKSGLLAKTIKLNELEDFDPFLQATVLPYDRTVEVRVLRAPRFKILGEEFGPYEDIVIRLPVAVATFLIAKNVATLSKPATN